MSVENVEFSQLIGGQKALKLLVKQDRKLRKLFTDSNWDVSVLDRISILKLSTVVRIAGFDITDPAYIYANREKDDDYLSYNIGFVPIGSCANGDFVLVFAAKQSPHFETGAVYIMSHDYGWEEAEERPEIFPEITRKISDNFNSFLTSASSENSDLPLDYFDRNEHPYQDQRLKRKIAKAKAKRKTLD